VSYFGGGFLCDIRIIATTDPVVLNQFGTKLKVDWNACPLFNIRLDLPWRRA